MKLIITITSIILITIYSCIGQAVPKSSDISADVIIYGGTSAAITSAVQLIKEGKSVVIVSPDKHLGGLSSSGLGFTDSGNKDAIGGLAREFYEKVYNYYSKDDVWNWQDRIDFHKGRKSKSYSDDKSMYTFEPHVAEGIFEDFVEKYKIVVYRNELLDREMGVKKKNNKIISITTLSGLVFNGKIFIDATYEGDLMASAGVSYHVGRESNSVYGEKSNGFQPNVFDHWHQFNDPRIPLKISPYIIPNDPESGLLPRISKISIPERGTGDHKIQAYGFRMCLTKVKENQVPFEKPEGYDPLQYELLVRVYDAGWNRTFKKFDSIPNLKTDVNNHGPFSFDNIGMNYEYPEASYEKRAEIIKEHETYQKGLLYFIANDPRIPKDTQDEMKEWGLAKDEFLDNDNWPYQIYVREARRMVGHYVMTEHEILGDKNVDKSIGMGSYAMDSHNVQRYVTSAGYVENEGDVGVKAKVPYKISLGSILPKKKECSNLIVPVALSSSHIAYGSIRMEPVFMILGQSAAVVASMSLEKNTAPHNLSYGNVKRRLEAYGQVLSLDEAGRK